MDSHVDEADDEERLLEAIMAEVMIELATSNVCKRLHATEAGAAFSDANPNLLAAVTHIYRGGIDRDGDSHFQACSVSENVTLESSTMTTPTSTSSARRIESQIWLVERLKTELQNSLMETLEDQEVLREALFEEQEALRKLLQNEDAAAGRL
jgi:hypothetical protein